MNQLIEITKELVLIADKDRKEPRTPKENSVRLKIYKVLEIYSYCVCKLKVEGYER